jgi:hypothetical protein
MEQFTFGCKLSSTKHAWGLVQRMVPDGAGKHLAVAKIPQHCFLLELNHSFHANICDLMALLVTGEPLMLVAVHPCSNIDALPCCMLQ